MSESDYAIAWTAPGRRALTRLPEKAAIAASTSWPSSTAPISTDRDNSDIRTSADPGLGVRIDLILESAAGQGGTLHGPVGAAAAFAEIERRQLLDLARQPAPGPRSVTGRAARQADCRRGLLNGGVALELVGRIVQHFRAL
ncbi:MAG TPA: hypothetical protein VMV07_14240, partial [Streptosporangiaceae bacterium]|nr:hypothetical protein [Streptosporangiaceae bacterium]